MVTVVLVAPVEAEDPTPQRDINDVIAKILGRDNSPKDHNTDSDSDDVGRRFFVFPTLGSNPALGVSFGALTSVTNYWGDPTTTALSSILISTAFTTKRQLLLVARSDYYTPNDAWHLSGDWRYYDFMERTHGLGSNRANVPSVEVGYDWYRFHQVVSRPLWGGLEVGVGYHLDARRNILARDEPQDLGSGGVGINTGSTTWSGVSLNLIYDRRDHPLNPERGVLGRASYSFYRADFGSDTNWDNLQLEGRMYQRLTGFRRQVLSVWGVAWLTRAGQPPYFDLPSVGWDTYGRTARGYRAGRFRGRDWVYAEVEYRGDLMRNGLLGGVAFVNTSRFSDPTTDEHQRVAHAAGIGIRLKLDKERRSNLALDVAWGRGGSNGVFLAVNEAF